MPMSEIDTLLENFGLKKDKEKKGLVYVQLDPVHALKLDSWARNICKINFVLGRKDYRSVLVNDPRNPVIEKPPKVPKKGRIYKASVENVALTFAKNGTASLEIVLYSRDLTMRKAKLENWGFKDPPPSNEVWKPSIKIKTHSVSKSDLNSAAANLGLLDSMLPKITLYKEAWERAE